MKTINQIKLLIEHIAKSSFADNIGVSTEIIGEVRDNHLPLLQFNIDALSEDNAQQFFSRIRDNVKEKTFAPYLPDGLHTIDAIGDVVLETPTIMEWQGANCGQNFVINYNSGIVERAIKCLNQHVINLLLSLPDKSYKLHFVDLTFSAQASFLTRNLDRKLYDKIVSSPTEWEQLQNTLREKMVRSLEEYGNVVEYNRSSKKVDVPYDVVIITDYQKCLNEMRDLAPLFENGHKGGIYFILMNNTELSREKDVDPILDQKTSYQILDAAIYGQYTKDAFIHCSPILDNPILAKACFTYINKGVELPHMITGKLLFPQFELLHSFRTCGYFQYTKGGWLDKTLSEPVIMITD